MKVLIVGLGSIGKQHVDAFLRNEGQFSIAALRSEKPAREIEHVQNLYSWDEVSTWKPDWVWITNPTSEHLETLNKASQCSKYIFMEKPLASTSEDVWKMRELIQNRQMRIYYGTILRCHPLIERARDLIKKQEFGKVLSYQLFVGSYLPSWRPGTDYRTCYSARKSLGGGVSIDLIHEFDYAEYLFGSVKKVVGYKSRVSSLEIDSDDLCESLLLHLNGTIGHIHLDYFRRETRRTFEICFEDGLISGNLVTGELTIKTFGETISEKAETWGVAREKLFDLQLRRVIDFFHSQSESTEIFSACNLLTKVIDLESL